MSGPVVAMAQMRVAPGRREENLDRACNAVAEAARGGADVVVLPETMDLGWTHASARTMATPVPDGEVCTRLRAAARAARTHVCAGLVESAGGRVHNAAVLIAPDGEVLLHHRKIAELDVARGVYDAGARLAAVPTRFGSVAILICADAMSRGAVLPRALGAMGARLVLSPCSWAVAPDHDNRATPYGHDWRAVYEEMAAAYGMATVAVSNVGPVEGGAWDGWRCIGNSLAVDGDGRLVAAGGHGVDAEELLYAALGG